MADRFNPARAGKMGRARVRVQKLPWDPYCKKTPGEGELITRGNARSQYYRSVFREDETD